MTFTIRHFAGDVHYNANGFLEKNKDALAESLIKLLESNTSINFIKPSEDLAPLVFASSGDNSAAAGPGGAAGGKEPDLVSFVALNHSNLVPPLPFLLAILLSLFLTLFASLLFSLSLTLTVIQPLLQQVQLLRRKTQTNSHFVANLKVI